MSTVTLYSFEDDEGEDGTFTTFNPREAEEHGRQHRLRVIAHEYEWADSGVVWDFTERADEDGDDDQ